MPDPHEVSQEMTKGVGDIIQKGLGIFKQGITGFASVLQSADSAVKTLDGSLTGQQMSNPGPQNAPGGVVANQVVTLVRQGRDIAAQANNAQAPGAVSGFQQAMSLLFQTDIPGASQLSDMMPSPTEVVQMGLRDLRGSTALIRLANGIGSMEDVTQVAQFTEDLVGRVQKTMVQPASPPKTRRKRTTKVAADNPPNPSDTTDAAPKKRRTRKKKEGTTLTQKLPPEGDIALAQAVSEQMDDDLVKGWFKEFEQGTIPEEEWVGRIGQYAHERGLEGLDEIMEGANARLADVIARRASAQS